MAAGSTRIGGYTYSVGTSGEVWAYDLGAGAASGSSGGAQHWVAAPPLRNARYGHACAVLSGGLYAVGGYGGAAAGEFPYAWDTLEVGGDSIDRSSR